jgi:hypothetical protein
MPGKLTTIQRIAKYHAYFLRPITIKKRSKNDKSPYPELCAFIPTSVVDEAESIINQTGRMIDFGVFKQLFVEHIGKMYEQDVDTALIDAFIFEYARFILKTDCKDYDLYKKNGKWVLIIEK